jgi:hypothetical protein
MDGRCANNELADQKIKKLLEAHEEVIDEIKVSSEIQDSAWLRNHCDPQRRNATLKRSMRGQTAVKISYQFMDTL